MVFALLIPAEWQSLASQVQLNMEDSLLRNTSIGVVILSIIACAPEQKLYIESYSCVWTPGNISSSQPTVGLIFGQGEGKIVLLHIPNSL